MFAIIGGSGFSKKGFKGAVEKRTVDTPYGDVVVNLIELSGKRGYFLPRHGEGHSFPPHQIPYKANIFALKKLGVERIIALSAVGSMNLDMPPGSLVIPDQFIDFTKNRDYSFSAKGHVYHIDVTDPFCEEIAEALLKSAYENGISIKSGGTYVVTEGPRFETPAEINAFRILGGDLVGMTLVPECVLARELSLCYLPVCTVTNYAAGISDEKLTAKEVEEMMDIKEEEIVKLVTGAIPHISKYRHCSCSKSQEGAEV